VTSAIGTPRAGTAIEGPADQKPTQQGAPDRPFPVANVAAVIVECKSWSKEQILVSPMQKILIRKTGECDVLEVVRETHAAAVGWPDIMVRRGLYRWTPPLPATLGFELSGRVEAVGTDVATLEVGQSVYLSSFETGYALGCYTDRALVPASSVRPLPDTIDLDQAANLGYVALARALLNDIGLRSPPRSILVIGAAGGTGTCLVQVARRMDAQVIASVG
jgi:NADPH:quinone reductase